ncbi:hypothetical protein ACFQJD_02860 [Haloplanus sp. GCM10025708]|uniref:hypothetical protein n=1 Tax=Haloplanus sp. GCM10025708 TaxID=3252679 RepID=UPI0036223915
MVDGDVVLVHAPLDETEAERLGVEREIPGGVAADRSDVVDTGDVGRHGRRYAGEADKQTGTSRAAATGGRRRWAVP